MRRIAILLVAVAAAGVLTVTASPPAGALSECSTTATAMIAHSCLTFWYNGRKGSPSCWESQLADV